MKTRKIISFVLSFICAFALCAIFSIAYDNEKLEPRLIREIERTSENDLIKIMVFVKNDFDRAALDCDDYDEYLARVENYFTTVNGGFVKSLPEEMQKDVFLIDKYTPFVFFSTTKETIYTLAEMDMVLGIGFYNERYGSLENTSGSLENTPVCIGDINADGHINSKDARIALQASAKMINLDDEQRLLCDITLDGSIHSDDARMILRIAAKLDRK